MRSQPATDDELRKVERLARYLTQEQIADVLGISARGLRKRLQNNPQLRTAYKKGKGRVVERVAKSLIQQALDGNIVAAIFFLKTQAGWRETDPSRIPASEIPKLPDRELEKRRKKLGLVG